MPEIFGKYYFKDTLIAFAMVLSLFTVHAQTHPLNSVIVSTVKDGKVLLSFNIPACTRTKIVF